VFVSKNATIEESSRKYSIQKLDNSKITILSEISDVPQYCKINCEAKVFQVEDPVLISTGKKVQNVVIGDGHGVAKISLWEDDVGMLQGSKSYRFERMFIKEYRGKMQYHNTYTGFRCRRSDGRFEAITIFNGKR